MIFWIFVILLVVGIGCLVISNISWDRDKHYFLYMHDDKFELYGGIVMFVSAVVLVIMLVFIVGNHITAGADVASNTEKYKALTYKLESGACVDEFGLLSKSVIDEIQDWNEDVAYRKNVQEDFWVGIFFPNVFDQFEIIDYGKYCTRE